MCTSQPPSGRTFEIKGQYESRERSGQYVCRFPLPSLKLWIGSFPPHLPEGSDHCASKLFCPPNKTNSAQHHIDLSHNNSCHRRGRCASQRSTYFKIMGFVEICRHLLGARYTRACPCMGVKATICSSGCNTNLQYHS